VSSSLKDFDDSKIITQIDALYLVGICI